MKIRDRLALNFSLISSAVLFGILSVIYLSSYSLLKSDFYDHLNDRAKVAGQLYLEADEISSDSLEHVRDRFLAKLPSEQLGIYDEKNKSFISNQRLYWSKDVLEKVREKKHLEFSTGRRQTVGIYYIDNQGNFVILVSAISKQNYKRLHTLLQIMIVLFIVVNGMFFFVGRWFAKRSLMPIQGLIKQMQLIKVNNLHLRVEEGKGKDEITELAQINPHFFFNTLNTIYSYTLSDGDVARTAITNLSKMMRYVLYDAADRQTPLSKEIAFIQEYVELMKLRITRKTSVLFDASELQNEVMIAPMLFLPFVENAFKHGVSSISEGHIAIWIIQDSDFIELLVRNTVYENRRAAEDGSNGIGILNTTRRLDLLYPEKYSLTTGMINETEYEAHLKLFL